MRFDPKDIVEHLRHNLERYPFGDGFPVLRELLQNADDAEAESVAVILLDGWMNSCNPLLKGPGLLLVNDGKFDEKSAEGMKTFGGSVKALDDAAVGRFGLGQKSVFHLCDAFVVVPDGYSDEPAAFVVNPFETLGREGDDCLIWAKLDARDAGLIASAGARCIAPLRHGGRLNLWFPLRRPGLRPKPTSSGIEASDIPPGHLRPVADPWRLAAMLVSLRHVRRILVEFADAHVALDRGTASGMAGYSPKPSKQSFGGALGHGIVGLGRELRAADDFRQDLRLSPSWPRTRDRDTDEEVPQKATPHGAAMLLIGPEGDGTLSADWSVLLPVTQAFAAQRIEGKGRLKLLLHGCFFVDSGRKAITGLGEEVSEASAEAQLRADWNRSVRDALVLPLIPAVLHDALQNTALSSDALGAAVKALVGSAFGREHRSAIAAAHTLARTVTATKETALARWTLVQAGSALRPLPAPDARCLVASADLLPDLFPWASERGLTLVCGPDALLAPETPSWKAEELSELLQGLAPSVFTRAAATRTLAEFLSTACVDDDLKAAATGPVLGNLRQTLASDDRRAGDEDIKQALTFIDCNSTIPLPPVASERFVLRALAAAGDAPPCLPQAWMPAATAANGELDTEDAFLLIAALQPLLGNDKQAEAAGAAALAVLRRLKSLQDALAHRELRDLPVVRALDGMGGRLLSLAELDAAARERRLFRYTTPAGQRLGLLAAALPDVSAHMLTSGVAKALDDASGGGSAEPLFPLADLDAPAVCGLVRRAATFGPPQARADLLQDVFSNDAAQRGALRALAAGDPRATDDRVRLVALRQTAPALDALIARLIETSAQDALVPTEIMDHLGPGRASRLSISMLEGDELGALLARNAEHLHATGLDHDTAAAILCSGVPDDKLRELPILPLAGGGWERPSRAFRLNPSWPLPATMAGLVPIVAPLARPDARQKADALIRSYSPDAQISTCLDQPEPFRFAGEILAALPQATHPDLERLRRSAWLCDRRDRPWKPEDVLDLPDSVLSAARSVLGDDPLFLPFTDLKPAIRDHAGLSALRDKRVLPGAEGSFERLLLIVEDTKPVAYMGDTTDELAEALADLARAGVDLPLPGWPLMKAMLAGGKEPSRLLSVFAAVEKGSIRYAQQWLSAIARVAEDRATGSGDNARIAKAALRVFDIAFRHLCDWEYGQVQSVLKEVNVPTADGQWRPAQETVARVAGIGPSHRLAEGLERFWPIQDTDRSSGPIRRTVPENVTGRAGTSVACATSREALEAVCAKSLELVLMRLSRDLPTEAAALLVGIVRRTDRFRALARAHGLAEGALERIFGRLKEIEDGTFVQQQPGHSLANIRLKTFLHFELTQPTTVNIETLTGERRDLPAGALEPLTVIGDKHRTRQRLEFDGSPETFLRRVEVSNADTPIEASHFERLLRTVAQECLGFQDRCLEALKPQIDECLKVAQLTVEDARARLEDRLPQILAELKPERGSEPRRLLDDYKKTEQSKSPAERAARLPDAKRVLWNGLLTQQASSQMLELIRSGIGRYGYGASRVLFELFQNADDASRQHPPPFAPEAQFEFSETVFRIIHWGRLINDLGDEPIEGERNGWQDDLFNMLVFNLSEKREDVTGRFGLGFKSVHLVAHEVAIASRFVSCRVRGGMLPDVWEAGKAASQEAMREGRRATIIELDLDPDRQRDAAQARGAFHRCARWLPATARAIRRIHIDGERFAVHFSETVATGVRIVDFEGVAPGQAIALTLDADTTLFLSLGPDGPIDLPTELPRLWLLAPLEEECGAGWLMNSYSFRVDPGRGRLAGDVDERAVLFDRLGRTLGQRLIDLCDLTETDWPGFAAAAGLPDRDAAAGRVLFLQRLVRLFATDVPRDHEDKRIETHLHRKGGLAHLFRERTALPTGLPAPFAPLLRADQVRWQLAGPLAEPSRLKRLAGWRALEAIAQAAVSCEAADLLQRLGFAVPPAFGAAALVRAELGSDNQVDPDTAALLGSLLDEDFIKSLSWLEQNELRKAAAAGRFQMADGYWREARYAPRDAADGDEERRILAFAPDAAVADETYTAAALAFYRIAADQSGFQRTADTFAQWAQDMASPDARRALLAYVVEGNQGERLGALLARERPHWLPDTAEALRQSALLEELDDDARGRLLTILYPSLARSIGAGLWSLLDLGDAAPDETPPDPATELGRIRDWWHTEHQAQRDRYDGRVWPNGFGPRQLQDREASDDRVGWFTFFALGVFRTLPWNHEPAHKSFVESGMNAGWWAEMAEARFGSNSLTEAELSAAAMPWLKRLEDFARPDAWRIDFPQWRRTIVDLYALARWLPDYVEAFRLLPRVIEREGRVALSDTWRLTYAPIWQRRGLEGAPFTQSLGLGANWMIREAIRHGLWTEEDAAQMHPYGWAATGRLRRLFDFRLAYPLGERGDMDRSPQIHRFVADHLGPDATFLGDLDLPLQLWNYDDFGPAQDAPAEEEAA